MKIDVKHIDTSRTGLKSEWVRVIVWGLIVLVAACTLVVVGYKWAESMFSVQSSYVIVENQAQLNYDGFRPLDRLNPALDLEAAINSGGLVMSGCDEEYLTK